MKTLQYGFVVSGLDEDVMVWQFNDLEKLDAPVSNSDHRARVVLTKERWNRIFSDFESVACERFTKHNLGRFKFSKMPKATRVPSSLGKELCVLCWGVEDAQDEQLEKILRNWNGLAPEERWWLYNTTAANCGQARQTGKGWRRAIHAALSEEGL